MNAKVQPGRRLCNCEQDRRGGEDGIVMTDDDHVSYLAAHALVDGRVVPRVGIEVGPDGLISAVRPDATAGISIPGVVIPGVSNLHSHAFQRAMAGMAERAGPDDFWQWRETMYRFVAVLSPDDLEAIAAQLYVECLLQGYTAVGEFHYLHNAPDGGRYADRGEMSMRIVAAAGQARIGLTLLPVLYRHGGFGGAEPVEGQRRFVLETDDYSRMCSDLAKVARVGVAPHSLRAVTPEELNAAVGVAAELGAPVHIHVAEQEREVADCLAWSGRRPVELLLDTVDLGRNWCLVHTTHVTAEERAAVAASGAVVGLCPSTEANLGDGIFPLTEYVAESGRFGVGSDSNVCTGPAEELRWLDYGQRLRHRRRNTGGSALYSQAIDGGAQALGRQAGRIAPGYLADLVVVDTEHPGLVGRAGDVLVDSWVFGCNSNAVRDVMVAGKWVVRDRCHTEGEAIGRRFAACMRRLADGI